MKGKNEMPYLIIEATNHRNKRLLCKSVLYGPEWHSYTGVIEEGWQQVMPETPQEKELLKDLVRNFKMFPEQCAVNGYIEREGK